MRRGLPLALLAACSGETGTITVSLTTAPGSTLLDSVQTLRLTVTEPRDTFTAERTSSGFALALELPATGTSAALLVEGLDGAGDLVANGASPPFPFGALDGHVVIYMAPPMSVGAAPLSLTPGRSDVAIGPLPYGGILAGGRLDSGAASDTIAIYNAYDHSLRGGLAMPQARSGLALAVGTGNAVYLFGGADDAGTPTATLWRYDTTVPPAGTYTDLGVKEGFARAGETMVAIGNDRFLLSGTPAAEFHALDGSLATVEAVPSLPAAGVTVTGNDGLPATVFAGPDGITRYREGTFTNVPSEPRAEAQVVALPGGKAIVVCGMADALRVDAASGAIDKLPGIPGRHKSGCAAAATARHLVIAGGDEAGAVDGTVEIFDAATLELLAATQLAVPRTHAVALALPNDQILIASGIDAAGAPVGTLELFTPPVE
jgi:hypothetical protein